MQRTSDGLHDPWKSCRLNSRVVHDFRYRHINVIVMVHELGICVFVCVVAASLCAFEGIFMCIWEAFSWAFYGCFVCILVNFVTWWVSIYYITSVYDIMWLIHFRPGWQNTFPPFHTCWMNNVTNVCINGPSRPYKAKKNNSCICDLK